MGEKGILVGKKYLWVRNIREILVGKGYWWALAGGRRVARAEEEESNDQLRPLAAAPPLPAALLLSRGGLPWRPCGGGCCQWPPSPPPARWWPSLGDWWATLCPAAAPPTAAPPRPGVGCSGENVYLVGEQSGGWWSCSRGHILVVGDCFGNLLLSCQGAPGEEMTAGSLDPGKLTLMLIFLQRNCKIKFCKRSAKQLKHLRTAK